MPTSDRGVSRLLSSAALLVCLLWPLPASPSSARAAGSQAPAVSTWARSYGGAGGDYFAGVAGTPDGGYVLAGASANDLESWAVRLTATGDLVWQKTYGDGTYVYNQAHAITASGDGGYVLAGWRMGADSVRRPRVFKIGGDGTVIWDRVLDQVKGGEFETVASLPDGGYLLGGIYNELPYPDNLDFLLVRLSASGDLVWQRRLGGDWYDAITTVVPATDGNYFAGGYSFSFGGLWIEKLDAAGNTLWQASYSSASGHSESVASIVAVPGGGALVTGSYHDNADYAVVVFELDSAGNVLWQRSYAGAGNAAAAVAANGDLVMATQAVGLYTADLMLLRIDRTGAAVWQRRYLWSREYPDFTLFAAADGGYLLAGATSADALQGYRDAWALKLDAQGDVAGCPVGIPFALPRGTVTLQRTGQSVASVNPGFAVISQTAVVTSPQILAGAQCPAPYSITGRVTETGSIGIPGALVFYGPSALTTTAGDGTYSLPVVWPGTYTVTVTRPGYLIAPDWRSVAVPPSASGQDFTGTRLPYSNWVYLPALNR